MFETFIAVGIVISLIYYEVTHLSPGGLITPGYLALFMDQPVRILSTFGVALVTYLFVKILKRYFPIYGRREFAVAVTIAILIKLILNQGYMLDEMSVVFNSIGVIVPGLIANDMVKQSVVKTCYSTAFVTVIMFLGLLVMNGSLL